MASTFEDLETAARLTDDERFLGEPAFSPNIAVAQRGQIRDWALVELDRSQFHGEFANKVYIGTDKDFAVRENTLLPYVETALDIDQHGLLPIQGVCHDTNRKSFWLPNIA